MSVKMIDSAAGVVKMADGTTRAAFRNTYEIVTFAADGTFSSSRDIRIEFKLFVNMNNCRNARWRKASNKQAESFTAN